MDNREKLGKMIDIIKSKFDCTIEADDTHRFVESDGFYEVQFTIRFENDYIYLYTKSGDSDLQDEWSPNNPQTVYWSDIQTELSLEDCEYAISNIIDYYNYEKNDQDILSEFKKL